MIDGVTGDEGMNGIISISISVHLGRPCSVDCLAHRDETGWQLPNMVTLQVAAGPCLSMYLLAGRNRSGQ